MIVFLAGFVIFVLWVLSLLVHPFGRCWRCEGKGNIRPRGDAGGHPPARHAAIIAERNAQLAVEKQPPAIEHHYHGPSIHIHGCGHDEAARLIRKALTEGEQR